MLEIAVCDDDMADLECAVPDATYCEVRDSR